MGKKKNSEKLQKYTVRWWYAGLRSPSLGGGTPYQSFVRCDDPEGKESFFRGIRGVHIGSVYLGGAGQMPVYPKADSDGDSPPDGLLNTWFALDEAAAMTRKKEIARAKRHDERPAIRRLAEQVVELLPEELDPLGFNIRALVEAIASEAVKIRRKRSKS
jgi:hypothetical protein